MRVFVCGHELGLGFIIARQLLATGHKVNLLTSFEDLIPNLTKNGINPVLGRIEDATTKRQLVKADAGIDAELPFTFPLKPTDAEDCQDWWHKRGRCQDRSCRREPVFRSHHRKCCMPSVSPNRMASSKVFTSCSTFSRYSRVCEARI